MLPTGLAVFPTIENLEFLQKDRDLLKLKPKVSKYAAKTKQELNNMILNVPMNTRFKWTLTKDHIRIALRYQVTSCFLLIN